MSTAYDWVLQYPLPWKKETGSEPEEESPLRDDFRLLRESLPETIARQISSGSELRTKAGHRKSETIATTLAPFDRLLAGGIPRGKLIEVAGRRSSGRMSLLLPALTSITSSGEAAALIDLGDHFDPQFGAEAGIDLERLLWVRPESLKDAVRSAELVVATGFALVVIDLGIHLRGGRVDDAAWVRLARAAEAHHTAVVVSSPFHLTATAPHAVVQMSKRAAQWKGKGKAPRILSSIDAELQLEKHRAIRPGGSERIRFKSVLSPESRER